MLMSRRGCLPVSRKIDIRRVEFGDRSATERSEEHTSELQSPCNLVCRLLLEKKKNEVFCVMIVQAHCNVLLAEHIVLRSDVPSHLLPSLVTQVTGVLMQHLVAGLQPADLSDI